MLRLIFVIMVNIPRIVIYFPKLLYYSKRPGKFSEGERYAFAKRLIKIVIKTSRVETEYIGEEKLPRSGGYIMFANHQGRYDPIGILGGHKRPCSFLLDSRRACQPLCRQFCSLLGAISIDKESSRDQIRALRALAKGARGGRCYLVFPEGIYDKEQGNRTREFKHGCFLAATHARCPIVPVTVIDSYRVYGENSLGKIKTKVIFHDPIYYEQYKDMEAREVSRAVRSIIDREIEERTKT